MDSIKSVGLQELHSIVEKYFSQYSTTNTKLWLNRWDDSRFSKCQGNLYDVHLIHDGEWVVLFYESYCRNANDDIPYFYEYQTIKFEDFTEREISIVSAILKNIMENMDSISLDNMFESMLVIDVSKSENHLIRDTTSYTPEQLKHFEEEERKFQEFKNDPECSQPVSFGLRKIKKSTWTKEMEEEISKFKGLCDEEN